MATPNLNLETIESTDIASTSMLNKMNDNLLKIDSAYNVLVNSLIQKTGKNNLNEAIAYIDSLVNAQDATITADKVFNGYTGYKGTEKVVGTALATASTGSAPHLLSGLKLYNSSGNLITGTMTSKGGTTQNASGILSGDYYQLTIPATGYYSTSSKLQRTKANVLSDLGVTAMPTINVTCDASTSYVSSYGAGINKDGVLVIWVMSASTSYEHICFYPRNIEIGTQGVGWNITSWDTADPVACYACTVNGLSSYSNIEVVLAYNTVNSSYDYTRLDVTIREG